MMGIYCSKQKQLGTVNGFLLFLVFFISRKGHSYVEWQ